MNANYHCCLPLLKIVDEIVVHSERRPLSLNFEQKLHVVDSILIS